LRGVRGRVKLSQKTTELQSAEYRPGGNTEGGLGREARWGTEYRCGGVKGESKGGVRNVPRDDGVRVGRVGQAWVKHRRGGVFDP